MSFEDKVNKCVPEGANFHGMMSSEDGLSTIVEYDIDGRIEYAKFKKLVLNECFNSPIVIPWVKGLTVSDVYEMINEKYSLDMMPVIDYTASDEPCNPSGLVKTFSVNATSFGYTGYVPVYVVDPNTNIIKGDRDISNLSIEDQLTDVIIQQKLGWKVFTSQYKLFNNYMPSMAFKELISTHLKDVEKSYLDDLLYGHVEKSFNDGLSDLITLRTPAGRLYTLRFSSVRGDVPVAK